MTKWWIPKQKQYLSETTQWYCGDCEEITSIERNPDWDGKFKGERPAPKWFVRCAVCTKQHIQHTEFECPNCGWGWPDETTMKDCTEPTSSYWASMEYGGNPVDWEETHECPECETTYTFTNGNY